jgi:putative FmdB family regulatory protein
MPIYTYRCNECRHEFEELVLSAAAEKEVVCPQCKTASIERRLAAFATGKSTGASAAGCSRGSGST